MTVLKNGELLLLLYYLELEINYFLIKGFKIFNSVHYSDYIALREKLPKL